MSNTPQTTPQPPSNDTQSALAGAFVCLLANNNAIILSPQFPGTQIQGLENANQTLATAVTHANAWNDTISANVQNQLQLIVNYNSLYADLVSSIEGYVTDLQNTPNGQLPPAGTVSNLSAEIQALQSQVQQLLYGSGGTSTTPTADSAMGTYNQLTQYQQDVANDESAFSGLMSIANNTSSGIPAEIANYQKAIAADNDAINKDTAIIAGGAAMIVTGVLICVVAVAIAPETGGASVAVVGAIGVAVIGGGAAMIGVASANLDKMNTAIADAQRQIKADHQEMSLLTTVSTVAGNLTEHTKNIVQAMATLQTTWQQMDNAMGDMVTALNSPEQELMNWVKTQQPGSDPSYSVLGTILHAQMVAPQDDWNTASTTASSILTNLKNVVLFQLPANTVPTQAAIAAASVPHQQVA
jgi:hypothetical protein